MSLMKKQTWNILFIFVLIITIAACDTVQMQDGSLVVIGNQESKEVQHERRIIKFLSKDNVNTETDTQIILNLSKQYKKQQPHVEVELENVQMTSLIPRVELLTASNDLPELFDFESGKPLHALIQRDLVLDIEKTFKELGIYDHMNPDAVDLLKRLSDGQGLYTIPMHFNMEGYWFNKQIFEKNNLKVPKTWTEMNEISDILLQEGIQPFSVAGKEKWPLTRVINSYVIRKYGYDAMDRVSRGELNLMEAGFIEAAEMLQEMNKKGYLGEAVNTIDSENAMDLFLGGKAAIFYSGSWSIADFSNKSRNQIGLENIGFFNIPLVEGGVGTLDDYSMNAGLTASIAKDKYDESVGQWLRFVFSRYGDYAMSEMGLITGFKVDNMPENVNPLTKMVLARIDEVKNSALWFEANFNATTKQLAEDNAQVLVTGGMTADEYMTELQKQVTVSARILSKNK